jgi:hypothetical protein
VMSDKRPLGGADVAAEVIDGDGVCGHV